MDKISRKTLLLQAAFALTYWATGTFGLMMALANPSATAVWPPSGLAIAALMIFGRKFWPAVFLGACLTNIPVQGTLPVSLAIAFGNTLEAWCGVWLLERFIPDRTPFDSPNYVFGFALFAALLSPLLAATIGTLSLAVGNLADLHQLSTIWLTWWLGDATGILLVAPAIYLGLNKPRFDWFPRHIGEASLFLLFLISTGVLVFMDAGPSYFHSRPIDFLCIPFLIWAALRLGKFETTLTSLSLAGIAIYGTVHGHGPFTEAPANTSLLMLQTFMGLMTLMGLCVATLFSQRKRAEETLLKATEDLEARVEERTRHLSNALTALKAETADRQRVETARIRAEQANQRSDFLANASKLLFSSLDYDDTLRRVARLIVSYFADWCVIYLVDDKNLRRAVFMHMDVSKEPLMTALQKEPSQSERPNHVITKSLESGESLLFETVAGSELEQTYEPERLNVLKSLGFESAMITPLIVHGRRLGVIKWVTGGSNHHYDRKDLLLADELAHYVAIAIENARLYTETMQAKEVLRERENSLNLALEAAQMADWDLDLTTNTMHRSLRYDQIFGHTTTVPFWDRGAMMGQIIPEDREKVQEKLKPTGSDDPFSVECRIRWPDGTIHWIALKGCVYHDPARRPIRMGGIVMDITDRKRFEEAMREARDAAIRSARTKAEFAANVSHEIRTPMNAIIGTAGLLLDTKLTPSQRRFATLLGEAAQSLLGIINDILDFSKIEAGHVTLDRTKLDVKFFLESVISLVTDRATAKNLEIRTSIESDVPPFLCGDGARIRQVLVNLISNAVKFTEKGSITIRLTKEQELGPKVTVKFSVIDTGIGMSPEQQSRLFNPFMQGDASTSRKYGGTGLGLAISKRLVDLMNGKLSVESVLGRGTTFIVQLPMEKVSGASPTDKKTPAWVISPASSTPKNIRLLVAEDNPVNQEVIREQLKRLGYKADIAANGQEVLKVMDQNTYDVILMDCQMPEMDGYEATKELRLRQKNGHRTIIIGLTANAMVGDREKCLSCGMDDYLPKPLTPSELNRILGKWTAASEDVDLLSDEDFLAGLRDLYREQTQQNLADIRAALEEKDAKKLREASHTLKGSSGQMKLSQMHALSSKTEQLALDEKLEEAVPVVNQLEREFQNLCESWQKGGHPHENGTRRR